MISANLSAVANHLWQSAFFTVAAWLLTLALRDNRAAIRYCLWLATSVKFLVPFSLLVSAGSQLGWRMTPAAKPVSIAHVVEQISRPFALPAEVVPTVTANPLSVLLFSIWFCGFAVSAVVWLRFWLRFRATFRSASPLKLDLPVPVMISPARLEPGVFGIRKPILLLPEGILDRLTAVQLEAILAHELCHVRRRDNLTAAIHMIVESIFWCHPLVWWIGKRLIEERERACDEDVTRLGYEPNVYAEGILNVCRFYLQSPLACASGVTGADLKKRIEAIVSNRVLHRLTSAKKLLLTAAGVIAVACPFLVGFLNASQSLAPSKIDIGPVNPSAVQPANLSSGDHTAAGVQHSRFQSGPLLLAQLAQTQATIPQTLAATSTTQQIRFEAVPEPPQSPLGMSKISGPIIESIEFRGTRISQSVLRSVIDSRVGRAYDQDILRHDSQVLYNTTRFSNVTSEAELTPTGIKVLFLVVERPLIRSIEYQGDDTVTIQEIMERFKQRSIKLAVETLYNQDELPRAAVAIQELIAERGRLNITIKPLVVEPASPPSAVTIIFRVEAKQ